MSLLVDIVLHEPKHFYCYEDYIVDTGLIALENTSSRPVWVQLVPSDDARPCETVASQRMRISPNHFLLVEFNVEVVHADNQVLAVPRLSKTTGLGANVWDVPPEDDDEDTYIESHVVYSTMHFGNSRPKFRCLRYVVLDWQEESAARREEIIQFAYELSREEHES